MRATATPPLWLDHLDCAPVTFILTLTEAAELPPLALFQLRREFSAVLNELERQQGKDVVRLVGELLFPQPAPDPYLQRQVQKPSAAVVLAPEIIAPGSYPEDHSFILPALFIGNGVLAVEAFAGLLSVLGERGIFKGQGRFGVSLVVDNLDDPSATSTFRLPKIVPLSWLISSPDHQTNKVTLELKTPMRLINRRKPLFIFDFNFFVSALWRRLRYLALAHGGEGTDDDIPDLSTLTVVCTEDSLEWHDWRQLDRGTGRQGIGGLRGRLTLSGEGLSDLLWILEFGQLVHVGKGASYGFGRFRLHYGL